MINAKLYKTLFSCLSGILLLAIVSISVSGQSTNVDSPTPISTDTIKGQIRARDVGDPRLTSHYYVFEGKQGDIFLKISTTNLNGDIDIFYADNLRPVTKISLYSDSTTSETGREVYLRQPERLILRVEGRTLNDDPAQYSIKFGGSFIAMKPARLIEEPTVAKTSTNSESEVQVNSVGTIIAVKPKPTPKPIESVAPSSETKAASNKKASKSVSETKSKASAEPKKSSESTTKKMPEKKVEVVVTDKFPKTDESEKTGIAAEPIVKPETKVKPKKTVAVKKPKAENPKTETTPAPAKKNPAEELKAALENIRLIVEFKDGAKIERPMNDVLKFGVDKGVLTIINKDGSIGKYSILEVAKITVE